jgi:hypothetical protein
VIGVHTAGDERSNEHCPPRAERGGGEGDQVLAILTGTKPRIDILGSGVMSISLGSGHSPLFELIESAPAPRGRLYLRCGTADVQKLR